MYVLQTLAAVSRDKQALVTFCLSCESMLACLLVLVLRACFLLDWLSFSSCNGTNYAKLTAAGLVSVCQHALSEPDIRLDKTSRKHVCMHRTLACLLLGPRGLDDGQPPHGYGWFPRGPAAIN